MRENIYGYFKIVIKLLCSSNCLWVEQAVENARCQIGLEIDTIEASGKVLNPVTLNENEQVYYCGFSDWRSGFFPGSVWYLYELTDDNTLLSVAQKYTEALDEAKKLTWHHDIGFIVNCSYGNGLRLSGKAEYKDVMIEAANSLCTRFREKPGTIQSWNVSGNSWQAQRGWECPVIIDNMMNLELLFEATKLSGDSTYYKIAVAHADRTLKEQFRPDGSCYHVIDYSLSDGSVRHRHTHKDTLMNLFGHVDKRGLYMVLQCVIVIRAIKNIYSRP